MDRISSLTGYGLTLREWADDDLAAMVELFDDADVADRTPLASPFDLAAARAYLERAREAQAAHQRVQLAITTDGTEVKGEVRLNRLKGTISYVVGAAHRGQGLAVRAVRLMTDLARQDLGYARVALEIEPDNAPSIAVARSAGFRLTDAEPEVVEGERRSYTLCTWVLDLS
ncbi:GNAT family N-acetyltransferase [Actinomadura sp. 21ATH]|uniref:GNAT family N-acetyltransferase n=1 Tax=Actinomadura sp. 21ATH TaxID=1735444 RepID=UPI0035C120FD